MKLSHVHAYHRKYPGGLEQFAADYKEAYTELAVIGETHADSHGETAQASYQFV
jgi:hypothetical protein